jgi:hypothetical protein
MDYQKFYAQLFAPLEQQLGPLDADTLMAIVGFDAGGPLNLCTIGRERGERFVTYVSCELAVRDNQKTGSLGPYELMMTSDDEDWCRSVLSDIGRMSLDELFEPLETLDIGPLMASDFPLQGIVFEEFASLKIGRRKHGILRCHGVTRPELEFAIEFGSEKLLQRLKDAGISHRTSVRRESIKLKQ